MIGFVDKYHFLLRIILDLFLYTPCISFTKLVFCVHNVLSLSEIITYTYSYYVMSVLPSV